jgi:hypothetical protein
MTKTALLALAALAVAQAAAAAPRVEVPIHQAMLEGGAPRYWVDLSIAGRPPIRAMLDTGSTGLRVLAIEAADLPVAGGVEEYGYTSGARYRGPIVKAAIALGEARADVRLQRVDTAACAKDHPDCPVDQVPARDYRIGGRGARGFTAILGANMADGPAPNPLKALADAWIIDLPRSGSDQPGRLILNPDAADRAGFTLVPTDPAFADLRGGFHDAVPGCVRKADGSTALCGPMLLDSGAPVVTVSLGGAEKPVAWPAGTPARLSIGRPGAAVALAFTTDVDQASKLIVRKGEGQPRNRISAGTLPFQAFAVLYDPQARILGLKPRNPAATETP